MILIVIEDDETIVDTIKLSFQIGWPNVKILSSQTGEEGLSLIELHNPDAVILDLGLPDMSGFDVLKNIRLFSIVPIIVLTVRSEEKDVIRALEMGADEYITKPFRQLELLARIKAIIRSRHPDDLQALTIGPFQFDVSGRRVFFKGELIKLTSTEYIILR
jgi:two-component system KDP operon response regulator KdpE